MSRAGIVWFGVGGVFAVARWVVQFADTQYYDPESLLDYSAVILQTVAGLATGIALITLWRHPPTKRGTFLIGLGGIAAIAQGLGNLFEDAFGWEWAEWGFFIGGMGFVITVALAGILTLTVDSPFRRVGVILLLGSTGGMLGFGLLVMGVTWISFAVWIVRRSKEPTPMAVG